MDLLNQFKEILYTEFKTVKPVELFNFPLL